MTTDKFAEYYGARDWIVNYLRRDLEGPHSENEVINDSPTDTYICGVLYPREQANLSENSADDGGGERDSNSIDPSLHLDEEDGQEDIQDLTDTPVSLSNARFPSSIGTTFKVSANPDAILKVTIKAARYQKADQAEDDQGATAWSRKEVDIPDSEIALSAAAEESKYTLSEGLELRVLLRKPVEGTQLVTLSLVNSFSSDYEHRPERSFFQTQIIVSAINGNPIFLSTDTDLDVAIDEDEESTNLLYRSQGSYALGHGCSPEWFIDEDELADKTKSPRASKIQTANIPEFELHLTDSNETIQSPALGMKYLATGPKMIIVKELNKFIDSYKEWVEGLSDGLQKTIHSGDIPTAERHIKHMEKAVSRMKSSLNLLESDNDVWNAFQLANKAMLNTRARDQWVKSGSPNTGPKEDESHRWYPFQLAFLLLCLESCAVPEHEDRKFLDLLWFPTGGGKTEAYLVIIAFVIFIRRIKRQDRGGGTSVLMRYSMRLLTVQQFERAARLICCCESIRKNQLILNLGEDPISLGLFLGRDGTPNTHARAQGTKNILDILESNGNIEGGNPVQIQKCPWCGKEFSKDNSKIRQNYDIKKSGPNGEDTLEIRCDNQNCEFSGSEKLPVYVVDEDLYRYKPTFVIATVDKFANLPFSPSATGYAGSLFGANTNNDPPDLIVQDELHLISGPLGSLTGIYETLIDSISENESGNGPKIIASTATIRNAKNQCQALFARNSFQFPPPALDSTDSYFAKESGREQKGTRLYLGLFAPGTSQQTLLVRTYAALLQGAKELTLEPNISDQVKDAYWTLLGYFNTRLLMGTAGIQSRDDIPKRIDYLSEGNDTDKRSIEIQAEMWGGIDSGDMRNVLDQLEKRFDDPESIDILFATNMISVGVDINRFGVQAMMGQPLSTAEYIQASSRVGRQYPGLVVVMYNSNKSRDRAHYEHFKSNHQTLYKQVESSTLTPFSQAARNRALHSVIVGLTRFFFDQVRGTGEASDIVTITSDIEKIKQIILKRIKVISPEEYKGAENDIERIFREWVEIANRLGTQLQYSVFNPPMKSSDKWPLLCSPDDSERYGKIIGDGMTNATKKPWETMSSLRNVDTNSSLYIYTG